MGCRMVSILIMALGVVTRLGDLENASEAEVDERIIPSIAELEAPGQHS